MDTDAAGKLAEIKARMDEACGIAHRASEAAQLVAVSKTFAAEQIRPFLDAGQRVFGENRVQEAAAKWPDLRQIYPDAVLHLIGPLQTNKVKEAVSLFDVIETLDRDSLAAALAKEFARLAPEACRMAQDIALPELRSSEANSAATTKQMAQSKRLTKLFVQVNTGQEPQKAGVSPRETVAFVQHCRKTYGLTISGLMCIPPADQPPGPHFALLAKLAKEAVVTELSMGMSADFEEAIWLGATYVRVGSALFGARAAL